MKIQTKLLLTSTSLIGVALLVFTLLNFAGMRFFMPEMNRRNTAGTNAERVTQVLAEHDINFSVVMDVMDEAGLRLLPVPHEFKNTQDVFLSYVKPWFLPLGITLLLVWGLAYWCTRLYMGMITKPLSALAHAAQRVEQGVLDQPVLYQNQDEFGALCHTFNRMQTSLLDARQAAQQQEAARNDMIAGISHDLRTPLTSVKGYIKGVQDGVATTPERQAEYLDIAYRRACDMETLLQRLFFLSQLDAGQVPCQLEARELSSLLHTLQQELDTELTQRGGLLSLHLPQAPLVLFFDYTQMYQVLTNLWENALRYATTTTTPLVLDITVERTDSSVSIRFSDNGPGVPPQQLPHLFERFFRGDTARSVDSGSGLGLYTVQRIIALHGGTVKAENCNGLSIIITLPWTGGCNHG